MSEVLKRDIYDASERAHHFVRTQDVEPILDENHRKRMADAKRGDFRNKWSLPNVMVSKFYNDYTAGELRPMNMEFWHYVDKRVMSDPDFAKFRTGNPSNPFYLGWKK